MFIKHLSENLARGWDLLRCSYYLSPAMTQRVPLLQASHPPSPMPSSWGEEECLVGVHEESILQ